MIVYLVFEEIEHHADKIRFVCKTKEIADKKALEIKYNRTAVEPYEIIES